MKISEMLDLIKNKEEQGFSAFYDEWYNMMYSVAFSVLGNREASEDSIQRVAKKLYLLDAEKFPISGHYSWLYRVVKNESLNNTEKEGEDIAELKIGYHDKDIEKFVNMDSYYSMIVGLSEKQKEIVTLKVIGGLTHKEIAQMLGKKVGTVQWTYNVAVHKLRISLSALASLVAVYFGSVVSRIIFIKGSSTAPGATTVPGATGAPPPTMAPSASAPPSVSPTPTPTPTPTIQPSGGGVNTFFDIWTIIAVAGMAVLVLAIAIIIIKRIKNKKFKK